MIRNQEEDEFVAVRVQDPRMQNEGSWNSYVDYKIFLHTNSKAFTAKTSCVRRRYSEFAWLKKKLQKNAGLVPVPDLPGKSFFYFSNEDFLERRRKGLQTFLDNVVNMTVCLSDSQLHLFLQTQLPVGHIQDCVQGHTPYTVTEAILTYASSNRGFAQAQEDDSIKEPSLTVSYESMESPAPHQPFQTPKDLFRPDLLSCGDSDPLEELGDEDPVEFLHKEASLVRVRQRDNQLEAVMEDCGPTEVTFFLGDIKDASEILEQSQQRSCQIQTPVEVHLPSGPGFEEDSTETLDLEETTVTLEPVETATTEEVKVEAETPVNDATSREEVLEVVCTEKLAPEPQDTPKVDILEQAEDAEVHVQDAEVHVQDAEVHVQDAEVHVENAKDAEVSVENGEVHVQDTEHAEVGVEDAEVHVQEAEDAEVRVEDAEVCAEDAEICVENTEVRIQDADVSNDEESEPESGKKSPLQSDVSEKDRRIPEEEQNGSDDITQLTDQQEVEVVGTKVDSDEDGRSSSNGSIVQVSDEEDKDTEDSVLVANGYEEEVEVCSGNIMDLQINGGPAQDQEDQDQEDQDLHYISDISKSLELSLTVSAADLTENSDFSILESSCRPAADGECLDPEDAQEVEVR